MRPALFLLLLAVTLAALAIVRPIDHDESQYVAAAVLSARGLWPYRDYAYFQTPLQPILFAPVALLAGEWAYPALRIVNAVLGAAAATGVFSAARVAGARSGVALAAAGLFAATDILLFSAGTARNDALPAALLAWALVPMIAAERGAGSRAGAATAGLLLAGAASAKLSYALPTAAYGVYALLNHDRHRPGWVVLGTAPVLAVVVWLVALAPAAAMFGAIGFPTTAPSEYYVARGQGWRLTGWAKALDVLKFLALGTALPALVAVAGRRSRLVTWLIAGGLIAALMPTPTWRQYLLPLLPPLFVALAIRWQERPPGRGGRITFAVFAVAGLAPSIEAVAKGGGLWTAVREGTAIRAAMDRAGAAGPVATLSPQFVPGTGRAIDPRFATGPFYFRSRNLLPATEEASLHLIAREQLNFAFENDPPSVILIGGEGRWTSGDDSLDRVIEAWAIAHRWRRVDASARFSLYLPPVAASRRSAISPS